MTCCCRHSWQLSASCHLNLFLLDLFIVLVIFLSFDAFWTQLSDKLASEQRIVLIDSFSKDFCCMKWMLFCSLDWTNQICQLGLLGNWALAILSYYTKLLSDSLRKKMSQQLKLEWLLVAVIFVYPFLSWNVLFFSSIQQTQNNHLADCRWFGLHLQTDFYLCSTCTHVHSKYCGVIWSNYLS